MKKITGYISRNGNIFIYFENPKNVEYQFIGAFIDETGLLSVVNPFQARFFALTWAQSPETEKKEVEVEENLESSLWEKVFLGAFVNDCTEKGCTEYFKVFMVQQPDKLEIFTYQTGVNWYGCPGSVGYEPQEPFLISKIINGELVKKEGRRKPVVRKFGFIPNPARTSEPEQWSKQDLIENFSLVEGERFIVTPYSEKENFKYALKIDSGKGFFVLGFLNENPGFEEE